MIKHILNTDSPHHNIAMSIALLFAFTLIITFKLSADVTELKHDQEIMNVRQNVRFIYHEFKDYLINKRIEETEETIRVDLSENINNNTQAISSNTSRIIQNKIDSDSYSQTSINYFIEEIWAELEYLRKKVE